MEQPETKRPRLSHPPASWATTQSPQGISLPPPSSTAVAASLPLPSGPHHHAPYPPRAFSRLEHHAHPAQHHQEDRRQYETEYPPMQEPHRQPPPSPSHQSTYGQPHHIETIIKRDPGAGDDTHHHMRRPNSTGNVPDGLPPTQHGPAHPGPHPDGRQMSFENGTSVPLSPATYRHARPGYHQPPTPISQAQYEPPTHSYGPPAATGPEMYPPSVPIAHAKRKAQRASQACEMCRQLKAKCDENKPCKSCKDKNQECLYRDPPAKQTDKVSENILDVIVQLRSEVTAGFRKIDKMEERMAKLERAMRQLDRTIEPKLEDSIEDGQPVFHKSSPETKPVEDNSDDEYQSHPSHEAEHQPPPPPPEVLEAQDTIRRMDEDEVESQPGPPVAPGKPSMPANHTTSAGFLLQWSSIRPLVQDLLVKEKIHHPEEFPIRQEQQRGVIRVFGRGEGFDHETRAVHREMEQAMADYQDEVFDYPSPSPSTWGQVGGLTPMPVEFRGGVLNSDGNPDFETATVWKYVQSFKDNILNMHPILVPEELNALVTVFLNTLPPPTPKQTKTAQTGAYFVAQSNASTPAAVEGGVKRKRSRSPAVEEQSHPIGFAKPGRPYRNVASCLVLVVLALGKICLHKRQMPDVVRDSPQETTSYSSPYGRNGVSASPLQGSPPGVMSQPLSSSLPSPRENAGSRRSSLQGRSALPPKPKTKRNFEVVPGLEYFALATDIFGNYLAAFDLKLVWAQIFAGLYLGQLGRVIESYAYIHKASSGLQVLLRDKFSRFGKTNLIEHRKDNLAVFAFWTSLQLESDILAELPLPQSGIHAFEEMMPYPNMTIAAKEGYGAHIISSYNAQLYLRKQLNQIHDWLYNPQPSQPPAGEMIPGSIEGKIKHFQRALDLKGNFVSKEYEFTRNDPPAYDILAARLRAKWWGSQVILHRPFVKVFLHNDPVPPHLFDNPTPPERSEWTRLGIDVGDVEVDSRLDPRIVHYARLGVEALVASTRAFHGMEQDQRIIITNVFGTAHAQWGNLVTLAACYRHHVLQKFIDRDTLSNLFIRTIAFFRLIVHPTSALTADMNILIGLYNKLGFIPRDDIDLRVNTNFSTATTTGPAPHYGRHGDSFSPPTPGNYMLPPPHTRP